MVPAVVAGWVWWNNTGWAGRDFLRARMAGGAGGAIGITGAGRGMMGNTSGWAGGVLGRAVVLTAVLTAFMLLAMFTAAGGAGGGPGAMLLWSGGWLIPAATVLIFAAAAGASTPRVNLRSAAIFVDQQAGLGEKVATALEMLDGGTTSELEAAFRAPVLSVAARACSEARQAKMRYQKMDHRVYAVAATGALAAGFLAFVTPLPALAQPGHHTQMVQVSNQAQKLKDVLKQLDEKKPAEEKIDAAALKPIQTAIQKLNQGDMSPIETSAVLGEAAQQLKKEKDEMDASDKVEQMLKGMQETQQLANAGDQLKDANSKAVQGDSGGQPGAQQALKDAAKALSDKVGGGMSASDRQRVADGLRGAAAEAGGDGQLQKELNQAADDAQKGDGKALSQDLQTAGDHMAQEQSKEQISQDSVKQAMDQIERMQGAGGGEGSESTMAGGNQGQNGDQSGGQNGGQGNGGQSGENGEQGGKDGSQGQNGGQSASGNQGQNGSQPGDQAGGQKGGQAGQPGSASAQGGGQGGRPDPASGSTMFEQRGGPGDHSLGNPLGGRETFVRIYDQEKTNTAGKTEKVGSQINPLAGPANGTTEVLGKADQGDSQIRTYTDELPDARQRAMDELSRQEIPPQYQDMVKEFYGDK